MKRLAAAFACTLTFASANAAEMTDLQKTLYALGQVLARNVSVFRLTKEELEPVLKGFGDGVLGRKSEVEMNVYGPKIQQLAAVRQSAAAEKAAAAGRELLAKASSEKGAVKADSGLVYRSLKDGSGAQPKASDTVTVHYRGTLPDGTEFDSSYKRKEPTQFPLNGVIPCWTEGVQKMKVGGKARLVCPPATAYGERGAGGTIPPNATLVFEIELLAVEVKK